VNNNNYNDDNNALLLSDNEYEIESATHTIFPEKADY
jgi:hypothetical protein